MEAEYNKRKQAEDKNKREAVRKLLNDSGTFIEREGQHFDDLNTADSPQLDFQVDWSVAPDWAKYFAVDENTEGWFFIQEPTIDVDGCWCCVGGSCMAFSHDYQGDWKDSLRKRP